MPSPIGLPPPSDTFLQRARKKFSSGSDAVEDTKEAVGGFFSSCCALLTDKDCCNKSKKKIEAWMDQGGAKMKKEGEATDFEPPFPWGIMACTVLIIVGGGLIYSGWAGVDFELEEWTIETRGLLRDFYLSADSSQLEVQHTYSVEPLDAFRETVTSMIEKLVFAVCGALAVIGVLMSLHSLAIRAAFKSSKVDAIFECKWIPAKLGWLRAAVLEFYVTMLHVLSIAGVVAGIVLFVLMFTMSIAAAQPDHVCDTFSPLGPGSKLLPELIEGFDDVLVHTATTGAPQTTHDVLSLGGLLVGHVGIETPCNGTLHTRYLALQAAEKCAQTTQLAGFSSALGVNGPALSNIPKLQKFCFSVISTMTATRTLCDSTHEFDSASPYIKQRLGLAASALESNALTLLNSFPKPRKALANADALITSGLSHIDEGNLVSRAKELELLMGIVLNSTVDVEEAAASACEAADHVHEDGGRLALGAVLVAVAAVGVRAYVTKDVYYLYNYVLDVTQLIKGIPWGAVYAGVLASVATLLILASLFFAAAKFSGGPGSLGLPGIIEAPTLLLLGSTFNTCKLIATPICLISLASIGFAINRGAYVAPDCAGASYKADADAALKDDKWLHFQCAKFGRSFVYHLTAFLAIVGVILLLPVIGVFFAVSQQAANACTGLEAAILDTTYPSLPFNATAVAVKLQPVLRTAKVVADGVLSGNPLSEYTSQIQDQVLDYDMTTFCAGTSTMLMDNDVGHWALPVSCGELLPTISIFLAKNPLTASAAQSEYYERLEPVCTEFEASLEALETFCGLGQPTINESPPYIKSLVVDSFLGWVHTLDKTLSFIFDNPTTLGTATAVKEFDPDQLYVYAAALDELDYESFYSSSCGIAKGLPKLAIAAMAGAGLLGLSVLVGWHLLNRYSLLTSVLDLDAQEEKAGGKSRGLHEIGKSIKEGIKELV